MCSRELPFLPGGWFIVANSLDRPVDAGCITLRDRRMKALEPYIASLRFDVPPPTAQRGLLDRLGAKQIEARMTRAEKKEREKVMKREKSTRRESVSSDESDDFWTEMKKLERKIQIMNLKAEEELEEKGKRKAERIEERRLRDIIKVEEEMEKRRRSWRRGVNRAIRRVIKRRLKRRLRSWNRLPRWSILSSRICRMRERGVSPLPILLV